MATLADYLQKVYSDIALELSKEMGDLFKSSEGRGSFNVTRLFEKIQRHLPTKYSFTRGAELFDSNGNHTNTKDFVIYDRTKNLFLSPRSDQTVLPVDTVYAVFEVKTTITDEELSRAVKQIQEVKRLHYMQKTLIQAEMIEDRLCETKRETGPPIGVIVGYTTKWANRPMFEKHLIEASSQVPEIERWDMFYVIDKAFMAVTQLLSGNKVGKYVSFVNLRQDGQGPDVGAMLLNFLLILESRLIVRSLKMPVIDYRKDYNLTNWLLHMHASSYDESGNPIPGEKT